MEVQVQQMQARQMCEAPVVEVALVVQGEHHVQRHIGACIEVQARVRVHVRIIPCEPRNQDLLEYLR